MSFRLKLIFTFSIFLFLSSCNLSIDTSTITSPVRTTQFQKLTTHQELMSFLVKVDSISAHITLDTLGNINDNYVMSLVKVTSEPNSNDKLKVLVLAQQHGDEPSGKEAVLELIARIANGEHKDILQNIDLYIFPQVNPWGGDHDERRNAENIDLNRDHLVLNDIENQLVHQYFHQILPEVTIDIHEYDPYYQEWTDFGYYKNADVQLGGVTNPNISEEVSQIFYDHLLPKVEQDVKSQNFSFLQYTLGQIYNEEGRLRHSTVHIDDGRQSFGIMETLSMIIEGKYGQNSVDNLQHRTESQYAILESILKFTSDNKQFIKTAVEKSRAELAAHGPKGYMGVRFSHVQNGKKLAYSLWSIKDQKDTIFVVDRYYPERVAIDSVKVPMGYLVPADDSLLLDWLNKHQIEYVLYNQKNDIEIIEYQIINKQIAESFEGWEYIDLEVKEKSKGLQSGAYFYVPLNQLSAQKIVLAFEPRSMLALFNENVYSYLLKKENYSIRKAVFK